MPSFSDRQINKKINIINLFEKECFNEPSMGEHSRAWEQPQRRPSVPTSWASARAGIQRKSPHPILKAVQKYVPYLNKMHITKGLYTSDTTEFCFPELGLQHFPIDSTHLSGF